MKKRFITFCLCMMMGTAALTGCGQKETAPEPVEKATEEDIIAAGFTDGSDSEEETEDELPGMHHVQMEIESYGSLTLELDADNAPLTVANFIKLAKEGFYDGLTFHRSQKGMFLQGGDPNHNGTGSTDPIKGEFTSNGVDNPLSHTTGAISMARTSDPNSGSCQFFICLSDGCTQLDGDYAVFGYVTEGLETLQAVDEAVDGTGPNGLIPEEKQPVIASITVVD